MTKKTLLYSGFSLPRIIAGIAILAALLYIVFATHTLWRGPVFVYLEPKDLTNTTIDTITIEGHVLRALDITINNYTATQNLDGYFTEEFAVFTGENVFTVVIKDKFGKQKTKIIRIIKTPQS